MEQDSAASQCVAHLSVLALEAAGPGGTFSKRELEGDDLCTVCSVWSIWCSSVSVPCLYKSAPGWKQQPKQRCFRIERMDIAI